VKRGDDVPSSKLVSVEQFKDFVRRVVATPKKEVERRLAEERRQRRMKRTRQK
jgi:hypothetical protein